MESQKISDMTTRKTELSEPSNYTYFGKDFDITFVFPENGGAMIFAAKQKLGNKSKVFEHLSCSGATDSEASVIPVIPIRDISLDIFKKVIEHIYGVPIEINEENYSELLYACRKYLIDDLTHSIIQFLQKLLNPNNIAKHFECFDQYKIKMLDDVVRGICMTAPLEVIGHLTCSPPHKRLLKTILKSPILQSSELELYTAIVNMLKRQEDIDEKNYRKELGNLIYLIRFPTLSIQQLVYCAIKPSLLSAEELIALLQWAQYKVFSSTLQFFSRIARYNPRSTELCLNCRSVLLNCKNCRK